MPPNRETPRDKYVSEPWKPGEEEAALQKRAMAIKSGTPLVITGARGDTLQLDLLATTIGPDGDIQLSVRITGTVTRGDRVATAKGELINIVVPATGE